MADFRIAHSLPDNYRPGYIPSVEIIDPYANIDRTRERLFLHTDKEYYYPADILWFKGYTKYNDLRLADSLSKVACVELIDSTSHVLQRVVAHVSGGTFYGSIDLPSQKGRFTIRAYTQ